jgi:hypothetical protein
LVFERTVGEHSAHARPHLGALRLIAKSDHTYEEGFSGFEEDIAVIAFRTPKLTVVFRR